MTTKRLHRLAFIAVASLALAACSGSSDSASSDSTKSTDATSDTSATSTWVRTYTGSTADSASGEPIRIGFATSSDLLPDGVTAADAAASFINSNAGGVNGRPIEIVHCNLSTPEAGTTCGTQFANDPTISIAVVGQALFGAADFYKAVDGKKPVFTASPTGADDFVSDVTTSYTGGALGASFGIAHFIVNDLAAKNIAVLITDDVAGRGGFAAIQPILGMKGAKVTPVFVPPTATAPQVESALQAVNVTSVDTLIVGVFEQGCIAAYDALKDLGVDATKTNVVAVKPCIGPKVQQHMKDLGETSVVPNGWYFNGFGYNPFTGDASSGFDAVKAILESSGKGELIYTVSTDEIVSGIVTMVKHLVAAGSDLSLATLETSIKGFTGPAMAIAGPQKCGASPIFKSICASRVSIDRYLDGTWSTVHGGADSIDVSPYLSPAKG